MKNKPKGFTTIKREMFLLSFVFLIIVMLLFAFMFMKLTYDDGLRNAKTQLHQSNNQLITYIEGMFHENATLLELLSQDKSIINATKEDNAQVIKIFNRIQNNNDNINYVYSGYSDGRLLIENYAIPEIYSATTRPWYAAAAGTNDVARLAYVDSSTGVWLFSQSKKLVDDNGDMIGAICIDSSSKNILRQLSTKYQYASQRSYIVDKNGKILLHPKEGETNANISLEITDEHLDSAMVKSNNFVEYTFKRKSTMAYLELIPGTDFFMVTAIDAGEVMSPIIFRMFILLLITIVSALLLGLLLSKILINRYAYPIMELNNQIQKIAAGEPYDQKAASFSNAEINDIAQGIEAIASDMTHHKGQQKTVEYLSFHDSMTGIYNRRFFDEELQRLDTQQNYPLCVICCDINGLKLTNDIFGHGVGNKLIMSVAKCLEKGCRTNDKAARIGGDKFAIIMPRTSAEEAKRIMLRIKSSFPKNNISGAEVSARMGFGIKQDADSSIETAIRAADKMMDAGKLLESAVMKKRTVSNIINAAIDERLVCPLRNEEDKLLSAFSSRLCPDSTGLLKDSYRMRKIGLCSLVHTKSDDEDQASQRYTETSYRILSALEEYRRIAGFVLHYLDRWDGNGAGMSGQDIPLLSRIMAVVEAYISTENTEEIVVQSGRAFDPEIVAILLEIVINK